MTGKEFFHLVGRVQKGLLLHATEEQIRTQLRAEGVESRHIENAIAQGRRLKDVRLGKEV